jgi:hypothetical protein
MASRIQMLQKTRDYDFSLGNLKSFQNCCMIINYQ